MTKKKVCRVAHHHIQKITGGADRIKAFSWSYCGPRRWVVVEVMDSRDDSYLGTIQVLVPGGRKK